jgi:hypothetical protein
LSLGTSTFPRLSVSTRVSPMVQLLRDGTPIGSYDATDAFGYVRRYSETLKSLKPSGKVHRRQLGSGDAVALN